MGNANGHVAERRKSNSGGGSGTPAYVPSPLTGDFNPHSAHRDGILAPPVLQQGGTVRKLSNYNKMHKLIATYT